MAVELPDATALGGAPSLRGDRPIPTPDTSAVGRGMSSFGADLFQLGDQINKGWKAQEDANAYSSYLSFLAKEDLGWVDTTNKLTPDQAQGFTGRYIGGLTPQGDQSAPAPDTYATRSKAFLDSLPPRLRQDYGNRLAGDAVARIKAAQQIELDHQKRQANATLDTTIDQSLMPRIENAAQLPKDDPNKGAILNQVIAQGDEAIDKSGLNPIDAAVAKQKWHEKAQTGFALALSPEEKAVVDPNSAGTQLGDTPLWGKVLDAIPYAGKLAIAQDGYAQYIKDENARRTAAAAADRARYNAYENAVLNNQFGLADVQNAYNSGQLNDADERNKLINMITQRDKEGLNLAAVTRQISDPNVQFNPFDANQRKAVDLWYDKGIANGGVGLLQPSQQPMLPSVAGAEGAVSRPVQGQTPLDPKSTLMWTVGRTGMVPSSAVDKIQGGIYSPDPQQQSVAFSIMDALSQAYPAAYQKAFTVDDRKQLGIYQSLAQTVPPDVLAEELAPATPQKLEERAALEKAAKDEAKTRFPNVSAVIGSVWGGGGQGFLGIGYGQPSTPQDDAVSAKLYDDYVTDFATAYSRVHNFDEATKLANKWIQNKWGVTDAGSADHTIMAYPPERYSNPVNGNFHWMDEQVLSTFPQITPSTRWGVVETPMTETEALSGKNPSYYLYYWDNSGVLQTSPPMRFNWDAAYQQSIANAREKHAAVTAAANGPLAQAQGTAPGSEGAGLPPDNPLTGNAPPTPMSQTDINAGANALDAANAGGGQMSVPSTYDYSFFGPLSRFMQITIGETAAARGLTPDQVLSEPATQSQLLEIHPDLAPYFDKLNAMRRDTTGMGGPNDLLNYRIRNGLPPEPMQTAQPNATPDKSAVQDWVNSLGNNKIIQAFRNGWNNYGEVPDPHAALFKEFFRTTNPSSVTAADVKKAYQRAVSSGRFGEFAQLVDFIKQVSMPLLQASQAAKK